MENTTNFLVTKINGESRLFTESQTYKDEKGIHAYKVNNWGIGINIYFNDFQIHRAKFFMDLDHVYVSEHFKEETGMYHATWIYDMWLSETGRYIVRYLYPNDDMQADILSAQEVNTLFKKVDINYEVKENDITIH